MPERNSHGWAQQAPKTNLGAIASYPISTLLVVFSCLSRLRARHWFAVNAHTYSGFREVADILAEIGHPEAERLDQEAEAYQEDIRAAVGRAMIKSPVVQLSEGTYA